MKMATTPNRAFSNHYRYAALLNLSNLSESPTQQALAVEYAKMGLKIFPCDTKKAPMVDDALGFSHGFRDATTDLKHIAKTWHKYPNAGIGLAIPEDLIVIDCDVKKDAEKKPILKDGMPDIIGLRSFQYLILNLDFKEADLDTLSVKTQSGGRHFFYQMPSGVPSFCHTSALTGLDIKGFGGYVILPNSLGLYGRYEFLNRSEIRQIPESLLQWALRFKGKTVNAKSLPIGTGNIDREKIISILQPYWNKGDGKRNELTLAIAGFLAHSGGREEDARFVISELARITGKGADHIPGARYAFHRDGKVRGFNALKRIMEEISDGKP